jgi:ubiquinone/menaquinone biosynthesis C-methylase UbiE
MSFLSHRRKSDSMRRFYNWFYRYYSKMEHILSPTIGDAVSAHVPSIPDVTNKTALEYACGTGILTSHLSAYFKQITAKDISTGMLSQAKKRAEEAGKSINFQEGNLLNINDTDKSYDWVFISLALHLFSPDVQEKIISRLLQVAREGVMIIDHKRKWDFSTAIAEWIEGSYYDKFIKMDFAEIAKRNNVREFREDDRERCIVLTFKI